MFKKETIPYYSIEHRIGQGTKFKAQAVNEIFVQLCRPEIESAFILLRWTINQHAALPRSAGESYTRG
jgi:hypothetical protein